MAQEPDVLPPTTALADGPLKVLDLKASAHHVEDLYPDPPVLTSKLRVHS